MVSTAKAWFGHCAANHPRCHESLTPRTTPKRLLSIGGCTVSQRVRLAVLNQSSQQDATYACLSYCWGKRQQLMLTRDTLERFTQDGVRLNELPATISNACELCDKLGIPYLFVDSLCILQDSLDDWTEISKRMCEIYSLSALTVAAAAGRDCREGLLGNRRWASRLSAELRCSDTADHTGTCLVRGRMKPKIEPLDLRAWAMQEDLLSPKLLKIGTAYMSWHCACSAISESEVEKAVASHRGDAAEAFLRPMSVTMRPRDDVTSDLWQALVWDYSRRKLSFEKDKLPAITGVALWLARTKSSPLYREYLAGIWNSRLPQDLLWYHDLPFPADEEDVRIPSKPRAPSWSWAAYDCHHLEWVKCKASLEFTKRLRVTTELQLDLEGPLKRGWLVPNSTHPEQFDFWNGSYQSDKTHHLPRRYNNCLGRARLDANVPLEALTDDLSVLRRIRSRACVCLRIADNAGLLIEKISSVPAAVQNHTYRRLGLVQFKSGSSSWWSDAIMETIRLA